MIRNVYWSACKIPAFPIKSEYNYNLLSIFSKNYQISNFIKIRPVRAEFLHVDKRIGGQTDMAKLTVTLGNFANASKTKEITYLQHERNLVQKRTQETLTHVSNA
jgi:hypothetical protein